MTLRQNVPNLLALVILTSSGCAGSPRTDRVSASNRPIAAASPAYTLKRAVKPFALGAGDSLGQAAFTRYAQAQVERMALQQAVAAKTQPKPAVQWLEPQNAVRQASAQR